MNKRLLLVCLAAAATTLLHQRTVEQPDARNFPGPTSTVEAADRDLARVAQAGARPQLRRLTVVEGHVHGTQLPVAAGHVVAQLADLESVQGKLTSVGSELLFTSRWTGRSRVAVPDGMSPDEFAAFLNAYGVATEARPDPVCTATDDDDDDDDDDDHHHQGGYAPAPLESLQWHHAATRTDDYWSTVRVGSHGGGSRVAVLDTGVAYRDGDGHHVVGDLSKIAFHAPYNAFTGSTDAADDHQHGTHIASVIAGHGGGYGTSYGRDLIPVKVLDDNKRGTESTLVDGIHHAIDSGAAVINMSLSFPKAYLPGPELAEAVARAHDEGIVMVASAGNDGEPWISYPAAFPAVVSVGAARMLRAWGRTFYVRAEYSNYGPGLDLMAPGGDVDRDENRDGYPDGILAQSIPYQDPSGPDTYFFVSGTSAAAAQVSGHAANLLDGGADAKDMRWLLHRRTNRMVENYWTSAFHPSVGGGLLDASSTWSSRGETWSAAPYGAAAAVVLTQDGEDRRGLALVQAFDGDGSLLEGAEVWVSWLGDVEGYGSCRTDSGGTCSIQSARAPGATLVGVSVQGIEPPRSNDLHRTIPVTHIELRALKLLGSVGTGLASSSLILDYDLPTLEQFANLTDDTVLRTVSVKSTGTGLASSSIVLGIDYLSFVQSPLADAYTVFKTGGTGLASSSIVLDESFYNLDAFTQYDRQTAVVWGFPMGTGLASSSIVLDQTTFAWDAFLSTYDNPGILYFNDGTGLASSSLILDISLWNPSLFQGTPGVNEQFVGVGTGLASSSFVFDYNLGTLDWLGFDTGTFDLDGTGLASSSLILDDAYLASFTIHEMSDWYALGLSDRTAGAGAGWVPMQ